MENLYKPFKTRVVKIEDLSSNVKLFRLKKEKGGFGEITDNMVCIPGQFVLAGLFGYGEAPFGIASSPYEDGFIDIVVRKVGTLTSALHRLKEGEYIFIRGPYGNGFPIDFMAKKDLIAITGGCGIPPIASLMEYIIENRSSFERVHLVYGARSPADLLLRGEYKRWEKDIELNLTVDAPDDKWKGCVGLVTKPLDKIKVDFKNTTLAMCGPWPMMNAVEKMMRSRGVSDRRIFVNVERKMQCGIGKCQHCVTGDKYVCKDGPVFNFDEVDKNHD